MRTWRSFRASSTAGLPATSSQVSPVSIPMWLSSCATPSQRPWRLVGPQGIREYMRGFLDNWVNYVVEARTLQAAGDIVVAEAVQRGEGKASGIEMEQQFFMLFTFRGGKIVRIESILEEGRPSKPPDSRSRGCRRRTWTW